MIHVKQTRGYEGDHYRGNCLAACIATIFEIPIDRLPEFQGRDSEVVGWLSFFYPGVEMVVRDYRPQDFREWQKDNATPRGYWIANVESPRFFEDCLLHTAEGGTEMPPFWYDEATCPHCNGMGTRPGFHAIVCRDGEVVHDPHPDVAGYDWSYNGRFCGVTTFAVTDPSRLIPRWRP